MEGKKQRRITNRNNRKDEGKERMKKRMEDKKIGAKKKEGLID